MALSKLSGDEKRILFTQLCNVLDPRLAVYLSSASHELRELTQALLPQLRADHAAAHDPRSGLRRHRRRGAGGPRAGLAAAAS